MPQLKGISGSCKKRSLGGFDANGQKPTAEFREAQCGIGLMSAARALMAIFSPLQKTLKEGRIENICWVP